MHHQSFCSIRNDHVSIFRVSLLVDDDDEGDVGNDDDDDVGRRSAITAHGLATPQSQVASCFQMDKYKRFL